MKDGDEFGASVSVFEDWVIIVSPYYGNCKGRTYLYRRDNGAWKDHQSCQASDGSSLDLFGKIIAIREKTMIVGATRKNN